LLNGFISLLPIYYYTIIFCKGVKPPCIREKAKRRNKLPRRKQRGIKSQSQQFPSRQAAGNLPAEIKRALTAGLHGAYDNRILVV